MARLILPPYGTGPANPGEQRTIQFLEENLPPLPPLHNMENFKAGAEYIVIPNIEIPDSAHRFLEIDAVIIAPHAVYVMEIKDWGPVIEGNDNFWYLNNKKERKNPHKTLNYKCRVLRSMVGEVSADLYKKVWFQGVIAIARDNAVLDFEGNSKFTTFPLDKTLTGYLKEPMYLSTPKKVAPGVIARFQKELLQIIVEKGRAKQSSPREIAGYRIEETLNIQDDMVEYLGRSVLGHGQGPIKRLRVFTLPLYKSEDERKKLEERIRRDYETLEIIGTHPNVVGLRGIHEHDGNRFVEVLDWAEEGTLRMAMSKGTLTLDQKFAIINGIALGLRAAHDKEIIHRDIRPENILMAPTGPQIMNFDRAYVAHEGYETVWTRSLRTEDRRYLPPELALPLDRYEVYDCTDLYSLGAIFYELMCGDLPFDGPEDFQQAGGKLTHGRMPSQRLAGIPQWADEVILKLYVCDIHERYEDIKAFLKDLYRKNAASPAEESQASPQISEAVEKSSTDPNRTFQAGERIGDFRITRHIKSGGFAQVYLATHVLHDREYAVKVNNQSVPLTALIDEFNFLHHISHPNIVKVNWSGQLPAGRYYIAMEYLKGESLGEYAWGKKRLTVAQILDVTRDMLSALRYLHEGKADSKDLAGKSLYHRDIKPNNIIWTSDRGYVLIDFNIAKEAHKSQTFAGTSPYLAPDLIEGHRINWNDSGDTFALGVTLYELLCKKHPYPNKEPGMTAQPVHPHQVSGCEEISDNVADFILKAVQPLTTDRFETARAMEEAFKAVSSGSLYKKRTPIVAVPEFKLTAEEKKLKNHNPFVKRLCRLFSQARHSNAGTRGLDEVARCTYIPTRLDEELIPAILHGNYRLVIITGNAGDGKTAFIQQLEAQAGTVEHLRSKNGSRFRIGDIPFESNYDGSQDEGDISNDEVLTRF